MTRCWEGPLGAVSPLEAPSWLTARPADHRQDVVPVAPGVRQPLEQHQAAPSPQADAVGGGGERLAPAVGGQAALAAELDEAPGVAMTVAPPARARLALAVAQGLHGQVDGDQGGGAGGVDGDRRAFQAQGVGDAAGGDAGGAAGAEEAFVACGGAGEAGGVVVVHDAGEDAGGGAAQGGGGDAGVFEGFPGGFEQEPLLGVHGQGFAGADAEEGGVELAGVVEEPAVAGVAGAGVVGVGVVERGRVPAAVRRGIR